MWIENSEFCRLININTGYYFEIKQMENNKSGLFFVTPNMVHEIDVSNNDAECGLNVRDYYYLIMKKLKKSDGLLDVWGKQSEN